MSETPDPTRLTFREFTREPVGGYIDIEKHWTEAELRDIFYEGSLVLSILDKCADLQAENARLTAALERAATVVSYYTGRELDQMDDEYAKENP